MIYLTKEFSKYFAIPQIYFQRSLNVSQAAATKPAPTEHAPEFSKYVTLVAEGDMIQTLEQQIENSLSLLRTIPSDKANFRYAPDKWSVKELLGHVIDRSEEHTSELQ